MAVVNGDIQTMEDEVVSNWIHDLLDDTTGGIDPDENILCCGWRSCGKCVLYKDLQLHIGMDHLSFEHYDTLVCFWDGCSSDKIFGSMQELREHIMLCHGNSQGKELHTHHVFIISLQTSKLSLSKIINLQIQLPISNSLNWMWMYMEIMCKSLCQVKETQY